MEKCYKVLQIGCGKMSKYIMKYIYEKNSTVVGAVDISDEVIGKDIGEIMESDLKGIKVMPVSKLEEIIEAERPDVAIITTMSFLNDILPVTRECVKHGVNVITTCEEAFYPENSNPKVYKELDILAKANGVTITGCGYQDVFWGNMIQSICGSTQRITKIKGSSCYNVEDYGLALAKAHGAGYTSEQFEKEISFINKIEKEEQEHLMNEASFYPSYMWNVVGWLSDRLGLHVVNIHQNCYPVMCDEEMDSDTLGLKLSKGSIRGMNAVVTAETLEGILFEVECIGKVYTKEEIDKNEWTVFGEPTTHVLNESPNTVELTCADVVNRIPDVVNSVSGFVPTSRMNVSKYYVNELR